MNLFGDHFGPKIAVNGARFGRAPPYSPADLTHDNVV